MVIKTFGSDPRIKAKILVVGSKTEHRDAVKEAYSTPTFTNTPKNALKRISKEKYDAVISNLCVNKEGKSEGIKLGEECLRNKIPFAILANGEKDKILQLRDEFYNDKTLVDLVGTDPVKELVVPLVGYDRKNYFLWDIAFNYARKGVPVEAMK